MRRRRRSRRMRRGFGYRDPDLDLDLDLDLNLDQILTPNFPTSQKCPFPPVHVVCGRPYCHRKVVFLISPQGGPYGFSIVLHRHGTLSCVLGPGSCVSCTVGHQSARPRLGGVLGTTSAGWASGAMWWPLGCIVGCGLALGALTCQISRSLRA